MLCVISLAAGQHYNICRHIYTLTIADYLSSVIKIVCWRYSAVPMFTFNNFSCRDPHCPGWLHCISGGHSASAIRNILNFRI